MFCRQEQARNVPRGGRTLEARYLYHPAYRQLHIEASTPMGLSIAQSLTYGLTR